MPGHRLLRLALLFVPVSAWAQETYFSPHQTNLFDHPYGHAVAWADFDRDGYVDLAVTFRNAPTAMFANDNGVFKSVAVDVGIDQLSIDTRSLAWGDFDGDGWPDLYVGFGRDTGVRNKLYRNQQGRFIEVGETMGVDLIGTTRQSSWIDYDNDGDSDLFVAMRDRQNRLLRNDGDRFTDVSRESGLYDPRRTVGAAWFDFDYDGDLDVFMANQSGDTDALYRNDSGKFVDVAAEENMNRLPGKAGRDLSEGSVGVTLCDVNGDGHVDLFVPSYGDDVLYVATGEGAFEERAQEFGLGRKELAVGADCGDLNNDGLSDIYLVAYLAGTTHGHDGIYWNTGSGFRETFPKELEEFDGDHGVRFADIDNDGDLDYAITNRASGGRLSVLRNELTREAGSHLFVDVVDSKGRHTRQGSEIRVFDSKTGGLIAMRVVDTGGGYISQNLMPTHVGLGKHEQVDVEVTAMSPEGRIRKWLKNVATPDYVGRFVTIEL